MPKLDAMTLSELNSYDRILVAFSGGKDSLACLLHLLDLGVDRSKVELWHHDIDGRGRVFMDWESTPEYCRSVARAFGLPIYFSWKEGGFEREMTRYNRRTAPICFETPGGQVLSSGGTGGKESTRFKFPQVSPDLSVRWCSAYLKIDVCAAAIRGQERFDNSRTLVVSGERAQESPARAKYAAFEPDRADNRAGRSGRHVDRWRPVHGWTIEEVWTIIERWKVRAHPAYYLGFGRCSCKFCIFGNADQFASAFAISPAQGQELVEYEELFGTTIKRDLSLVELVAKGTPYPMELENIEAAISETYLLPIFMETWALPSGAFAESCGPV